MSPGSLRYPTLVLLLAAAACTDDPSPREPEPDGSGDLADATDVGRDTDVEDAPDAAGDTRDDTLLADVHGDVEPDAADADDALDTAQELDTPDCADLDLDGICDSEDNCPSALNPDQADVDADGLGDVCDPAPGTVGDAPPDGVAIVPTAGAEQIELDWNDEVTVRINGPLEQHTYTLIAGEPEPGEFARYTLYQSANADVPVENPATVTFRVPNDVSDAMTSVRFATSSITLNLDENDDGIGELQELVRCEYDVTPCANTAPIDLDENMVAETWNVVADVARTGVLALSGALPPDPVVETVTPATWWQAEVWAGDGDPDMELATWDDAIALQPAWLATNGGPLVAVIGDGFDTANADVPFVNGSGVGVLINGYDYVSNDTDSSVDVPTVGTAVASLIAAELNEAFINGIAYGSDILAVRGLGGTVAQMAAAIEYAADQGAKVIVVIGGTDVSMTLLSDAIEHADSLGALVVASVGGYGGSIPGDKLRYPAAYEPAIAVAGLGVDGTLSDGSRYGDWVDIAAPSIDVVSSVPVSAVSNDGTHYAAAMVAGAAALVWDLHPGWSAAQVREHLLATASGLPTLGERGTFGALNIANAVTDASMGGTGAWITNSGCSFGQPDFLSVAQLGELGVEDGNVLSCSSGAPGADQGRAVLPLRISEAIDWRLSARIAVCTEENVRWRGAGYDDIVQISSSSSSSARATPLLRIALSELAGWTAFENEGRLVECTPFTDLTSELYTAAAEGITSTVFDMGDSIGETWLLVDHAQVVPE